MDLLHNLTLGFSVALSLPEPALRAARLHGRHADRRAARHRPGGDHRDAAADHLPSAADRRADHAGRHLLRRAVRRLDDVDPGQPAGRSLVGRDLHRRLPDGPQGPRRRGALDLGARLVLRRHGRHPDHRDVRRTADAHGAEIRPRRLLLADGPGPRGRRRAGQRLGAEGDRHGVPRPAVRPGRHRREHRRAALHLRHSRALGRHRLRADRHGPVRHRRDRGQPRTTNVAIRRDQGDVAVADPRGNAAGLAGRHPRHVAGLDPRRAARRRPDPRRLLGLYAGEEDLQDAARSSARARSRASRRPKRPTTPRRRRRSSRC